MSYYQCENPAKRVKIDPDAYSPNVRVDAIDHIVCYPGQIVGDYLIKSILGEGSFGRVATATCLDTGNSVALKLIKNDENKRIVATTEIQALTNIAYMDPGDESLCIKMLDCFVSDLYYCIVLPVLGLSLFEFIKLNNFEPFPIEQVRHISQQLCTAAAFLHRNGMTHTDLKPENILFVNSDYITVRDAERNTTAKRIKNTDIRLIDFGFVTQDQNVHTEVITTRYYRAPEVILELGWSHPSDVWSAACVIVEIYFGSPLFDTHEDREHLGIMEKTLGPIPLSMGEATNTKYFKDGILDFKWEGWEGMENEISEYYMPLDRYKLEDSEEHNELFDLLEKLFVYEPDKRILLSDALQHPFFQYNNR